MQGVFLLMTTSAVDLINVLQNFPKQAKDKTEEEKEIKKDKKGNKKQQQKGIDYQCFAGPVFFILSRNTFLHFCFPIFAHWRR